MIPKTIHYCWFGKNPLPPLAEKCIESWRNTNPEFMIARWDESNFDVNMCEFTRQAYEAKKWAFVSDVARLWVLSKHGGIYLDTDVELIKPIGELIKFDAFSGFEDKKHIGTGIMGCVSGHPFFRESLLEYQSIKFTNQNGGHDLTTNVTRLTDLLLKHGLAQDDTKQTVAGVTLLPTAYFSPTIFGGEVVGVTQDTVSIHYYEASWKSEKEKRNIRKINKLTKLFGYRLAMIIMAPEYAWDEFRKNGFRGLSDGIKMWKARDNASKNQDFYS